jgi:hypothetical protein
MSCTASTIHVHDSCSSVPPPTVPSTTMHAPTAAAKSVADEAATHRRPHSLPPATTDAKATAEAEQGGRGEWPRPPGLPSCHPPTLPPATPPEPTAHAPASTAVPWPPPLLKRGREEGAAEAPWPPRLAPTPSCPHAASPHAHSPDDRSSHDGNRSTLGNHSIASKVAARNKGLVCPKEKKTWRERGCSPTAIVAQSPNRVPPPGCARPPIDPVVVRMPPRAESRERRVSLRVT